MLDEDKYITAVYDARSALRRVLKEARSKSWNRIEEAEIELTNVLYGWGRKDLAEKED